MYPAPPMQGSMSSSPKSRPPSDDDYSGSYDDSTDSATGDQMGVPPNPAAQFAGMPQDFGSAPMDGSNSMLGQPMGGMMGGPSGPMGSDVTSMNAPGVGADMALNQARAEFTQAITVVQSLAQNYPMAQDAIMMAVNGLVEAMTLVGQAVQQPPVAPEVGP